jgi:leader peptidase (prepilin peptidase) / N-methyltransferase
VGVPDVVILAFVFAFGCCIGSFLNVVAWRLPRGKSLVHPGSACPHCGNPIRFYDNIPLVSWLVLGGILLKARCRRCRCPISGRYFVVELLTGLVFLGVYVAYFRWGLRSGMPAFEAGGGLVYLTHIVLLGAFIAASIIDMESWIIPLSICWFATGAGLVGSAAGAAMLPLRQVSQQGLLPMASPTTGALAVGASVGLAISLILVAKGVIRRSYESESESSGQVAIEGGQAEAEAEENINHRLEILKEIVFLTPIVLCSILAWWITRSGPLAGPWSRLVATPVLAGLLGSGWGYFIGCTVVWTTRILGTLAFGKEAMGLGDVHLMGAAGAVVGPVMVVLAFFLAPFFGLAWAVTQLISKKIHQIPYGPFLSLATLMVMIFHDGILGRLSTVLYGP